MSLASGDLSGHPKGQIEALDSKVTVERIIIWST